MQKKKKSFGGTGMLATVLLFVAILVAVVEGALDNAGHADQKSIEAAKQAIERAAVVCYATEGFYPPSLSYLEERYGLQVDHERYSVRYEVFSDNITPSIVVVAR